jgi:Fic-DOC domain mobile mystery protein B
MINYHYIEGQTPLDEDEKRDLIPTLITREDLDAFEQENILEARKWIMQKSVLAKQDIFTEKFILNLHKRMYGHVWKWAGTYRKSNKNIGIEYYLVPTELRQLLDDATYWLENETYSVTDLAIIFHHRLVKIHLFPNGNGRHARLCADVIVAKYGGDKLTWGGNSDLTKPDDIRKAYIAALREADAGNYEPLLVFAKS